MQEILREFCGNFWGLGFAQIWRRFSLSLFSGFHLPEKGMFKQDFGCADFGCADFYADFCAHFCADVYADFCADFWCADFCADFRADFSLTFWRFKE